MRGRARRSCLRLLSIEDRDVLGAGHLTEARLMGLAGAPAGTVEALTEYGERVGRAFQLGDDLLDITAETAVAGKAPGGDLRAGVRTLPVLYLLRRGGADAARLATVLDGDRDDRSVAEALDLLRSSPALAEARLAAQADVDGAKAALAALPLSPVRVALEEVADRVLDREV